MNSKEQEKNNPIESQQEKEQKKETNTKKKVINTKPDNYKETEQMAKQLLNTSGENYYEWLDQKHKEYIFDKMLENQNSIVDALSK